MNNPALPFVALAFMAASLAHADFIISSAPEPFTVSFRGAPATTHFGWGSAAFEGATENEQIDSPAPTLGADPGGVALTQLTPGDILASSNNVYNGVGPNSNPGTLQLIIPTSGTVGTGFTTIIIQGQASGGGVGGGSLTSVPGFGPIQGVLPTAFVWGGNAANTLQWWVKYELPGNLATYNLQIALNGGLGISPTSIANLQVDTLWSATGHAADEAFLTAPVVEPVVVNTPPTISVAGKTNRSVGARTARATITGTASDESRVTGVFYSVGSSGLRTASGTENWQITSRLASGRNVLRIFAVDATGQISATRRVVITRR